LAFDVTRRVTYKNLNKWFKELRSSCPDIPVILVANKIDVDMAVTNKRFNFPVEQELPFYFVSASDGTNVVKVFREIIKLAVKNKENPPDEVLAEIYNLLREDDSKDRKHSHSFFDSTAGSSPTASPEPNCSPSLPTSAKESIQNSGVPTHVEA